MGFEWPNSWGKVVQWGEVDIHFNIFPWWMCQIFGSTEPPMTLVRLVLLLLDTLDSFWTYVLWTLLPTSSSAGFFILISIFFPVCPLPRMSCNGILICYQRISSTSTFLGVGAIVFSVFHGALWQLPGFIARCKSSFSGWCSQSFTLSKDGVLFLNREW